MDLSDKVSVTDESGRRNRLAGFEKRASAVSTRVADVVASAVGLAGERRFG